MTPGRIVAVLFIYWAITPFFPGMRSGLIGFLGGSVSVWLVYLLLSHTPKATKGGWESRDVEGRD